jgi:hypothetical protein
MVAEPTPAEFGLDAPAPDGPTTASDPEPSRAIHTRKFPALLRQLGASFLVTTNQAGKLVIVRDGGGHLNTHGLSQVRESAVFSGIPITEPMAEDQRTCGVCVVDLASGQVVALLRFDTAVQEVFAVAVLPRRFPS